MMEKWSNYFSGKRVWVTGASGGIGRAMVEALGEAGVDVVASDIREDLLSDLAQRFDSVRTLPMDITDSAAVDEKATRAWDLLGAVDILMNNAGVSQRSLFAETNPAVLRRIIEVNLIGTMLVTRAVVARMLAGNGGHLVTITSMAARVPTPQRTMYSAAKMGLHGLFDSLRGEVEPKGIAVTLVLPGVVRTDISAHAMTASGDAYGITDRNQAAGMPPDECAGKILNGVAAHRREFTVAMVPKLRLAVFVRRFLPALFFKLIAKAKVT